MNPKAKRSPPEHDPEPNTNTSAEARIREILLEDLDERPEDILDSIGNAKSLTAIAWSILDLFQESEARGTPNVHLLKERAVLLVGAILWRQKIALALPPLDELEAQLSALSDSVETRLRMLDVILDATLANPEEHYLAYINQFLEAVNQQEMLDFQAAKVQLLSAVARHSSTELRIASRNVVYHVTCPMRVGISSANASDNWTFSKLRGGAVLNFALNLSENGQSPRPPISAKLRVNSEPRLVLETIGQLRTDRATQISIGPENAIELFALPPGAAPSVEACFKDIHDPLLMLKYSLVFCNIVGFADGPDRYLKNPALALEDIARFTGGAGLCLSIESGGPSRSGFASSSCVALSVLAALYGASHQDALLNPQTLSSLALLFENQLGLKSGKQDTDGPLYPGVKSIHYGKTTGFLQSEIRPLKVDESALRDNLVLVNSGIQRPAASGLKRGLNMRHYSYLSRDTLRFPAVLQSLEVHECIVDAVTHEDWPTLGHLFTEYLNLRETIDPGATQSIYDAAAGRKVLRVPFDELLEQGLIHGGMYTGAMGGGCMMLVPTELGKMASGSDSTALGDALERLRHFSAGESLPFQHWAVYNYAINARGLILETWPRTE